MAGLSVCHDGPPPPPPSSESAAIEPETRKSGEVAFPLRYEPSQDSEYVECSDAFAHLMRKLFGGEDEEEDGHCCVRTEKLAYDKNADASVVSTMAVAAAAPRKQQQQESLSEMVMWVKEVATDPCDPGMSGTVQEWRKWQNMNANNTRQSLSSRATNSSNGDVLPNMDKMMRWRKMILRAREALFMRITIDSSIEDFTYRKKQKLHHFLREACGAPASMTEQTGASCLHSCSFPSFLDKSCSADSSVSTHVMVGQPRRRSLRSLGLLKFSEGNGQRKRIPIGPFFQADVPEWTGSPSHLLVPGNDENLSESRWLGTQIWPVEGNAKETALEMIGGKGLDSCSCLSPRSVDCIRYHVTLARLRLKYELGQAFYSLGFDDMGEEVSRSWTWEEQMAFDTLVRLNPLSEGKSFLDPALKFFVHKNRRSIASYYFNVFVLRRMSIQNRMVDGNADSDDDEFEGKPEEMLYHRTSGTRDFKRKPGERTTAGTELSLWP